MRTCPVFLAIIFLSLKVFSFEINVNPKEYKGDYQILGYSQSAHSGEHTLSLEAGSYYMLVGAVNAFKFTIDNDGSVSVENGLSAQGGFNKISFNTVTVKVDSSSYAGDWRLPSVTGTLNGNLPAVVLVPGLSYLLQVASIDSFRFSVDQYGNVHNISNTKAASAAENLLQLQVGRVQIKKGNYKGKWRFPSVLPLSDLDASDLDLVLGIRYQIQVASVGSFVIFLDGNGKLHAENGISGTTTENVLVFNTIDLDVLPEDHSMVWSVSNLTNTRPGALENISFIPGVKYRIYSDSSDYLDFDIESSCDLLPNFIRVGENSFNLRCSKPSIFTCEEELNYDATSKCVGVYKVRTQGDLEAYLLNYGEQKGRYRNLSIEFNIKNENVEIYSPCKIKLAKNTKISAKNICISGRKGVRISNDVSIKSSYLGIISSKKIHISGRVSFDADEIQVSDEVDYKQ